MIRVGFTSFIALVAVLLSNSYVGAGHPHCHVHRHYAGGWSVSGVGVSVGYAPIYAYSSSWNACYRPTYFSYGYAAPVCRSTYYAPSFYPSYYNSYPTYYYSWPTYYRSNCGLGWGWYGANDFASPGYSYAYSAPPTNFSFRVRNSDLVEQRWLASGDAAFRAGRYVQALGDYRRAEEEGYSGADLLHRKAHAYLAAGQYRLASSAFKQAFKTDSRVDRAFSLDDLYGAHVADKTVHIERLAELASTRPDDFDSFYLLGIMLHYNGESARAEKFFAVAEGLPESRGANIAAFRRPGAISADDITPIVAERPIYVGGKDT